MLKIILVKCFVALALPGGGTDTIPLEGKFVQQYQGSYHIDFSETLPKKYRGWNHTNRLIDPNKCLITKAELK